MVFILSKTSRGDASEKAWLRWTALISLMYRDILKLVGAAIY